MVLSVLHSDGTCYVQARFVFALRQKILISCGAYSLTRSVQNNVNIGDCETFATCKLFGDCQPATVTEPEVVNANRAAADELRPYLTSPLVVPSDPAPQSVGSLIAELECPRTNRLSMNL